MRWLILAQTPGGGTDPLPLISYGALGMVVLALLTGLLWAKPAVQKILDDCTRITKQRDDLLEVITKEVMPNLTASTQANQAIKPVLEEVVRVLAQVHDDMRPRTPAPRERPLRGK